MNTENTTIRYFACLCCLLFVLTACDKKKAPPSTPKKVVSQKITVSKPAPAGKPKAAAPERTKKPAITPKSDITLAVAKPGEPGKPEIKLPVAVSGLILMGKTEGEGPRFRKEGLNPFEPLFKQEVAETETLPVGELEELCPPPTTPLEEKELTQLRLVAIILSTSGNKALVEEKAGAGKGYVVEKGDRIGKRCGEIIEITKNKVIVKEKERDMYGKVQVQDRELELPKLHKR